MRFSSVVLENHQMKVHKGIWYTIVNTLNTNIEFSRIVHNLFFPILCSKVLNEMKPCSENHAIIIKRFAQILRISS